MQYDLESFWSELSEQSPSGEDLEYDSEFMTLERTATSRGERAVGDSVIAAEAPDWERVREQALALSQRTRDLRVAMHLTRAWTSLEGVAGWSKGMAVLRGLLEQQWATVHPQLDAEDDDDPTARINVLVGLVDGQGALGLLRSACFVSSPRLGRYSLRDLRIADGTIKPAQGHDGPLPSRLEIEACCRDCPLEELEGAAGHLASALEHARAIDAVLSEKLGYQAPDLKAVSTDLAELERFVKEQWQLRNGDATIIGQDGGVAVAGNAVQVSGQIQSLEDVRRRLDEICDFYERNEPSSPVPLMLRRARRLVGCDFMELLKDLAPGGLDELERVVGRSEDE